MLSPYKSFLLKLLLFTAILWGLLIIWNFYTPESFKIHHAYIIPLHFFIITSILHIRLVKSSQKEPKNFVYSFMGSTALRMFITLIALVIYILIDKANAMNFAVAFLFGYFVYLIFEVVELQKLFRK